MVIFRKICFATRSAHGSLSHSVLHSLLIAAKRQGQQPLTFFKTLFTSDTATAQAAFCNLEMQMAPMKAASVIQMGDPLALNNHD